MWVNGVNGMHPNPSLLYELLVWQILALTRDTFSLSMKTQTYLSTSCEHIVRLQQKRWGLRVKSWPRGIETVTQNNTAKISCACKAKHFTSF